MAAANYQRFDEALELLTALGPDLTNGMTSHVPMVAEALCAMGHGETAVAWVARHRHTVVPRTAVSKPIAADGWRQALGQHWRFADWSALFLEEIARDGWLAVCDRWVGRLAPGFPAAATHGVIRVGHAARALGVGETRLRLQELADGLALWASTYVELPATRRLSARLSPADALARVPLLPEEKRQNGGAITVALGQLVHAPGFDGVLDLIDDRRPARETALEAAEAFARVVAVNVHTPLTAIVFTHGVTGMGAALNLLPHVRAETGRTLVAYAWQSGAALMSAYATAPFDGAMTVAQPATVDRVARAVAHGDDHVIKLTEACLALNAVRSSAAFLAAVDRVAAHLPEDRS
ncbi:MAG: DUF4243 domain-containing protein [Alphaproteobacteria bacterium]|nr:DUF4243 domain-containing protein [Alphaproteobacteria bacterium]